MELLVRVEHQRLKLSTNLKTVVEGTQKFIKLIFELDDDWDTLTTFAQFQQGGKAYNQYLDEESCAELPPEIKSGSCLVTLYGTGNTVIATTNCLELIVEKNNLVSDASSIEISQSLYDQLVDRVNNFMTWDKNDVPSVIEAINLLETTTKNSQAQIDEVQRKLDAGEFIGETGPQGIQGIKGDNGITPNLTIGDATSLGEGSIPTVAIRGDIANPVIDFGIPKGDTGAQGIQGQPGVTPDIKIGEVATLPEGSKATAEITGTPEKPVIKFGIPQGIQGIQGQQGIQGIRGEQGVQGIPGKPGVQGIQGEPGKPGLYAGSSAPIDKPPVWLKLTGGKVKPNAVSGKEAIEAFCPTFEKTGPVVTCQPAAIGNYAYPLSVKSQTKKAGNIKMTRCGKSFVDVAPFRLTMPENRTVSISLAKPLTAGNYNIAISLSENTASIGALVLRDGNGKNIIDISIDNNLFISSIINIDRPCTDFYGYLSASSPSGATSKYESIVITPIDNTETYTAQIPPDTVALDWTKWQNQTSDGVWHDMAGVKPDIQHLPGVNNLYSDTGDTTVSGREVPYADHTNLQAQIDELKKAIISQGGNV